LLKFYRIFFTVFNDLLLHEDILEDILPFTDHPQAFVPFCNVGLSFSNVRM
jgi:hypothetical protein